MLIALSTRASQRREAQAYGNRGVIALAAGMAELL